MHLKNDDQNELNGNSSAAALSPIPTLLRRLNWDHLKKFYYIAHFKSFTRAAVYLSVSQPTLSHLMANLEARIRVKLFERVSGSLVLTATGERVFQKLGPAFNTFENIAHDLEDDGENPQGMIRLWADQGLLGLCLMTFLEGFIHKYPGIHLNITATQDLPTFNTLEADVLIRPRLEAHRDLVQVPLRQIPVRLYAHSGYLQAHGTPQTPEDLDHHRLIAFGDPLKQYAFHNRDWQNMNWHLTAGTKPGYIRQPFMATNVFKDCLHWTKRELGMMTSLAHPSFYESNRLVEVLGHISTPSLHYHVVYAKSRIRVKRIQLLQEYMRSCFQEEFEPKQEDKESLP